MGRVVVLLLILIVIAGGVFYFFHRPLSGLAGIQTKKATEWTPENISKDPLGYLASAGEQIKQAVASLNNQKNNLLEQKDNADKQIKQNAEVLNQTLVQFDVLRDAYKKAISSGSWPVDVSGKAYQESDLKAQILSLSKKIDSLQSQTKQFNEIQQTVNAHVAELERKIVDAEAKQAEIIRQSEIAKAKKTLENLETLQADIDGLSNISSSLDSAQATPSVEQLIERENASSTDDDFRAALLRESHGMPNSPEISPVADGPFFDPEGKPLVWYRVTETGDYELFSRPGTHPKLGTPLEPMTSEAAAKYDAWKKNKDKQTKVQQANRVAKDKARKDDAFRNRYVNMGAIPRDGQLTLLAVSGKGNAVQFASQGVTEIYRGKGFQVVPNAFTNAFSQGELFEKVSDGDSSAFSSLGIADRATRVVLAKITFGSPRPTGMQGLTTVDGTLTVSVCDGRGNLLTKRDYSVPGAGVDMDSAERAAGERLLEMITKDAASLR